MTRVMRWAVVATVVATMFVLGAFVVRGAPRADKAVGAERDIVANLTALAKPDSTKLIHSCDRLVAGASLGLRVPTLVSREGGETAVLFANQTRYTLCVLTESKNASANHPALITRNSKPVEELQSSGNILKVQGRSLYSTNVWFVVRVSVLVTSLKVVTYGASEVTSIGDHLALVHESGKVDVEAKGFSYGDVVGFGPGGSRIGSAALS
jgi:hypothetical protein